MDRIAAEEMNFVRRETPSINGSLTAFIVVVVVLIVVIIASCSAAIYLIRDGAHKHKGQEAQRRPRYDTPLGDNDLPNPPHSKKWFSYLWGSRDRHNHPRSDKPATMMGHSGQGWIRTNDREWDVDSADEHALRSAEGNQSVLFRMSEQESRSSIVGPHVYTPRMHSPSSDGASSIRYDPHALRGLPYPEQFVLSAQATIPSIQSQLYSPTSSSSPSSPVPRRIMSSPEPIANAPSHDSGDSGDSGHNSSHDSVQDSLSQSLAPTMRTLGSGTKFFESL